MITQIQTPSADHLDRLTTSFAIDKLALLRPSQERSLFLRLQANSQISLSIKNPRPQSSLQSDRLYESRFKLQALKVKNRALSLVQNFNAYFWLSARMSVILTGIDVYSTLILFWTFSSPGVAQLPSRPGWGILARPKKFGRYARSQLHQCGGAWQLEQYEPEECLFITGTLPGGSEAAKSAIASWSGYVINRLMQYVRRQGLLDWAYCWEQQKRGALHLHLILHCPDPGLRQWWIENFKSTWYKILCDVSDCSGTDLFERKGSGLLIKSWRNYPEKLKAESEICRKNIAGYLAKYMGKTAAADKFSFDHEVIEKNGKQVLKPSQRSGFYSPSRWWGCSFHTKKLIRKYQQCYVISNSSSFIVEQFLELLELLEPMASGATEWIDKTADSYTKVLYHFPKYIDGSAIDTYQFFNSLFAGYSNLVDFSLCSLEQRSLLTRLATARQQNVEQLANSYLSVITSRHQTVTSHLISGA